NIQTEGVVCKRTKQRHLQNPCVREMSAAGTRTTSKTLPEVPKSQPTWKRRPPPASQGTVDFHYGV
ncbi:hypothetical protein BaRGS_00011767, partial [Batillaria attramentaria]